MAGSWNLLLFGDSWVSYGHPTWSELLGPRIGARVFNFAVPGSLCGDLTGQGQRAISSTLVPKGPGGQFTKETVVLVHAGGNDFIMKMVEGLMASGGLASMFGGGAAPMVPMGGATPEVLRANPGVHEAQVVKEFMSTMYRAGARYFLLSGVPAYVEMPIFNMIWGILGNMVNQNMLEDIGVGPGDPAKLVMEVQGAALFERWETLARDFRQEHTDVTCALFDEVGALERLRTNLGAARFDREMWDFSMFHPTAIGHQHIVAEAQRCVEEQLSTVCSGSAPAAQERSAANQPAQAAPPQQQRPPFQPPQRQASGAAAEPWDCPRCTLHNEASALRCAACEMERPGPEAVAAAAPEKPPAQAQADDTAKGEEGGAEQEPLITVRVRNVKGDVTFAVQCGLTWRAKRFREAVLAVAPFGFAPAGAVCMLAVKGKFLTDGAEALGDLGIADGAQIIAVMKPAAAKA